MTINFESAAEPTISFSSFAAATGASGRRLAPV